MEAFTEGNETLPGDYRTAMSHRVTSGTPIGWTAFHCLLSGSDVKMETIALIKKMLDPRGGKFPMSVFDEIENNKVIVFFSFLRCDAPHIRTYA